MNIEKQFISSYSLFACHPASTVILFVKDGCPNIDKIQIWTKTVLKISFLNYGPKELFSYLFTKLCKM